MYLPTRPQIETARLYLTLLMLGGVAVGLVFSPPVLSVGLIGLVVLGLLDPLAGLNPRWRAGFGRWAQSPLFWGLVLLYLLLLAGVAQTADWGYYLQRLRVKAPLVALPLAWAGLPPLTERLRGRVFAVFSLFVLAVLTVVLVNYALNFAEINDMVRRAQPVPVPRNHIRFSLLVALATLLAVGAWRSAAFGRRRAWLWVAALLFAGQHLLAVRSGLAGAYAGLGVVAVALAWERGRWWPAVGALVALILLPVLAYAVVPTFRTKMQYARYELLHRDPAVDPHAYSDEGRLTSLRLGLDVWRDHPWFGVGPGNLLQEMDARYAAALPGQPGKRPHNQFVSALAGSGLVGLAVTVVAFGLLLWPGLRRRAPVYLAVWTVFFLSCQVENTLETSAGVSMFVVFLLLAALAPRPPGEE